MSIESLPSKRYVSIMGKGCGDTGATSEKIRKVRKDCYEVDRVWRNAPAACATDAGAVTCAKEDPDDTDDTLGATV